MNEEFQEDEFIKYLMGSGDIPEDILRISSNFDIKLENSLKYILIRRISKAREMIIALEEIENSLLDPENIKMMPPDEQRRMYSQVSNNFSDLLETVRKLYSVIHTDVEVDSDVFEIATALKSLPSDKLQQIQDIISTS